MSSMTINRELPKMYKACLTPLFISYIKIMSVMMEPNVGT
jgi:hypothetical protein